MKIHFYLLSGLFLFVSAFAIYPTNALSQNLDVVLVDGDPPLRRSTVAKSIDLLEWSLDVRIPAAQKSKMRQIVTRAWETNNRAQMQSVLESVDVYDRLSRMSAPERAGYRDRLKSLILENLRRDPNDELSRTVLSVIQPPNAAGKALVVTTGSDPASRAGDSPHSVSDKLTRTNSTEPQRSDGEGLWTFSRSTPLTAEEAKAILQKTAPADAAVGDDKALTFEQSIANARKFLNESVTPRALDAFNASPQARHAKRSAVAAGGAMMANRPLAALAGLLRAHELEPRNATYLVSLAAILSLMGMPREALGVLNSPIVKNGRIASPLGMGGGAGALTIRGFALLKLGRAKEAENALRQAVAQAPTLREARINLAFALWAQDDQEKKEEGARLIAAVWRRTTPRTKHDITKDPGDPIKAEDEIPIEIFGSVPDLSKGKRLHLPDLRTPNSLETSVAMSPKYQKLMQMISANWKKRAVRRDELLDTKEQRIQKDLLAAADSSNPLAAVDGVNGRTRKLDALHELVDIEKVRQHPAVRPLWEKARKSYLNGYQGIHFDQRWSVQVPSGTSDPGSQSEQLVKQLREIDGAQRAEGFTGYAKGSREKYNKLRCEATRRAHAKWRAALDNFDAAHRDYLQAAYKHMTAVIANIADPLEHELAQLHAERQIYSEWHSLVMYTDSFHLPADRAVKNFCGASAKETDGGDLENLKGEKADRCPDILKGSGKAKIDFEVISVSFNCGAIGVEISSPWLGFFVEAEGKFKGGWISQYEGSTIGWGLKGEVEIPGVPEGLEGKAGCYVKVDKDGNVKDFGFKTGVTTSKTFGIFGVETGADVELTILPALGMPLPED